MSAQKGAIELNRKVDRGAPKQVGLARVQGTFPEIVSGGKDAKITYIAQEPEEFRMGKQNLSVFFVCASFVLAMMFIAADKPAKNITPRYSVSSTGVAILITDNQTNKLYMYVNDEKDNTKSKLYGVMNLEDTGKDELSGTKGK